MSIKSNKSNKPSAEVRQINIKKLLQTQPQITISELAERFDISKMTARRDLDKLEAYGVVRRTFGGAMPTEKMSFEFNFASRRKLQQKAKWSIAHEAIKLLKPVNRIIIDNSTTALELAYLLKDEYADDLTVVTPSLAVASVLQYCRNIKVILLGGILQMGRPELLGFLTEENLDKFSVDIAFQSVAAIGPDGTLYNKDVDTANVHKKIRRRAERVCILADSSKIGKTSLITNGFIFDADIFITDEGARSENIKAFEKIGAKIVVAKYVL